MKIKLNDLKDVIREEFMKGVPEFMLREATDECVGKIRMHMKRYIQQRAQNPRHSREMMDEANATLDELETEMYELVEKKIWKFAQQT